MKLPPSLEYWVRTARLDPKALRGNDTAVVFIHGIRSHCDQAFQLADGSDLFFWDLLKDDFPFKRSSFFAFNYGRVELYHITEGKRLEQTLENICYQLHGAISEFKNVILVGHSQGGLVATMYGCIYGGKKGSEQSVLVVTLHTPHRNKSMMVMKHTKNEQWILEDRFYIPHLFCASLADNIVKPDNAIDGALDASYTAHDQTFRELGHSHLNRAPSTELIGRIKQKAAEFLCSGYSYPRIDIVASSRSNNSIATIRFSRSKKKLEAILIKEELQPSFPGFNPVTVYNHALRCPIHLAKRCEISSIAEEGKVEALDLDNYYATGIFDTINWVCLEADGEYSEILFDPMDFEKDVVVKNEDFLEVFARELREQKHSLRDQIRDSSFTKTMDIFNHALGLFWESIVRDIWDSIRDDRKPGITKFRRCIEMATRKCFEQKRFRNHKHLYQTYKREFFLIGWAAEMGSIDCIVANLFRSDGEIYRLDRDISNIFSRLAFGTLA